MTTNNTKEKEKKQDKPAEAVVNQGVENKNAENKNAETPAPELENREKKEFSREEVDEIVAAAVREALAEVSADKESAPVLQVAQQEYVTLMFVGSMANGCVVSLGDLGQINRSFGTIDVPKRDFFQKRDFRVDKLLEKRKLVVLGGLDGAEVERFGLEYGDGELLDFGIFSKILDFTEDELALIFSKLCESHKRTVATTFITAYESGDARVTQEKAHRLNDISRAVDADGLFTPILEDMGRKLSE